MAEVPELWWSPARGVIGRGETGELHCLGFGGPWAYIGRMADMPDDVKPLAVAEPVDDKGRTPTYLRGEADGWNAARAGAEPHDQGVVQEWTEVHLTGKPPHSPDYDFTFRSDQTAWRHEPRLVQLARESWGAVKVETRHVRQVTYSTEWTERPTETPEAADA